MNDTDPEVARRRLYSLLCVGLLLNAFLGGFVMAANAGQAGPASLQTATAANTADVDEVAPYYADNTTQLDNESWFEGNENATLDSFVTMLTRLGTFVIGDTPAQNGGPGGAIVVGLVLAAAMGSTMVKNGPGPVGGVVLGLVGLAGVTAVGLAPVWLLPVVLFVLGLILTSVVVRVLR
jgi:hypothetical protein